MAGSPSPGAHQHGSARRKDVVTSAKGCLVPTLFKSQAGRVGEEGWCEPCCFSKASFTELETHPRNVTAQEAGAGAADRWGICGHQELWPQDTAPPAPALVPDHLLGPSATFWLPLGQPGAEAGMQLWQGLPCGSAAPPPPLWKVHKGKADTPLPTPCLSLVSSCRSTRVQPKGGSISQHCPS